MCSTHAFTFTYACIAAGQAVPFFSVPVQPNTEDHQDDPTRSSNAGYKSRLLDYIGDLLGQRVLLVQGVGDSTRRI